jgi:hypothetical protein
VSKVLYNLERFGPLAFGLLVFGLLLYFRADIQDLSSHRRINVSALYSAVFGWASIQTGFLFSVYGFIASKTDGFIAEIKGSRAMTLFKRYTMRAMLIGFGLTLLTIPLIVTGDQPLTDSRFYVSAAWFSVFAWAFAAFLRVALNFGLIVSVPDRKVIPG